MSEPTLFLICPDGSVGLSIGEFCIETAAKRAHRELAAALLDGRASQPGAHAALDLLVTFLSTTDFAVLRSETPALAGGTRVRVRLHRGRAGVVRPRVLASSP